MFNFVFYVALICRVVNCLSSNCQCVLALCPCWPVRTWTIFSLYCLFEQINGDGDVNFCVHALTVSLFIIISILMFVNKMWRGDVRTTCLTLRISVTVLTVSGFCLLCFSKSFSLRSFSCTFVCNNKNNFGLINLSFFNNERALVCFMFYFDPLLVDAEGYFLPGVTAADHPPNCRWGWLRLPFHLFVGQRLRWIQATHIDVTKPHETNGPVNIWLLLWSNDAVATFNSRYEWRRV